MSSRLAGKVAVITGAASGIGAAAARLFAAEGAKVVVADCDERGQALADEIGGVFCRADVAVAGDVQAMIEHAEGRFGRLDILFSNAGAVFVGDLLETPEGQFDKLVAVNLKGTFLCIRAAIPALRRAGGGVILTTASGVGLVPRARLAAYAATKAAIIQLTRSVALEYAKEGIRAISICPGAIDTPMHSAVEGLYKDPTVARGEIASLYPLGRYGTPDEVAHAAVFLASDEAAYITGIALPVDGGRTLH